MAYLVIKNDSGQEVDRVELSAQTVIGRSSECNLRLNGGHLSRKHLRIERIEDEWVATDLESKHGTFVNDHPISRRVLKDGDAMEFGDFIARFHDGAPLPRRFESPRDALFAGNLMEEPPLAPKRAIESFPAPKPKPPSVGKDDPLYCDPVEVRPEDANVSRDNAA